MFQKFLFTIIWLLLLPIPAFSTKYAGEFLSLGVGARALGMGGAFVAIADDASSIYWNPAGIFQIKKREVLFMHSETFGDLVNYDYLGYVHPWKDRLKKGSTLGISLLRLGVDEIPNTTEALLDYGTDGLPNTHDSDGSEGNGRMDPGERLDYGKIQLMSNNEMALLLAYSFPLQEKLLGGANVKVVRKSIGTNSAWGLGLDLGFLAQPLSFFSLGLCLQDATTTLLLWNTGRQELITSTLKVGVLFNEEIPLFQGTILIAFDGDFRFEGRESADQYSFGNKVSLNTHLGMEYWFKKLVGLRLGLDEGRFSSGAGLIWRGFKIDYAFLGDEELNNSHRISGGLTF